MRPVANGSPRTDIGCVWPDCFAATDHPDVPLCNNHYRVVGLAWTRDNIDVLRASITATPADDVVLDAARRRIEERRICDAPRASETASNPTNMVVYYIRIRGSDRIKIGTTKDLGQRLVALRADRADVLAYEPGGYELEARRHREYADERYGRREEFAMSDRLRSHINTLRARAADTPI